MRLTDFVKVSMVNSTEQNNILSEKAEVCVLGQKDPKNWYISYVLPYEVSNPKLRMLY